MDPTELCPEPLLREALAPRRPDAAAFQARVEARIAAAEAERETREAKLVAAPPRLRMVAGFLPPGLLPVGLAGLAGKKLTLKAAPGLLALPVVSLAMVLVTFLGAVGIVARQRPGTEGAEMSSVEVRRLWWRRNRTPALLTFALLAVLVWLRHSEVAVVLVLVSMAMTAMLLAEMARAGLTDRKHVGKTLAGLLWNIALYWYFMREFLPADPAGIDPIVAPWLLAVGAAVCVFATHSLSWARVKEWLAHPVRMRYPDKITTWSLRVIVWPFTFFLLVLVVAVTAYVLASFAPLEPSRAQLAEWVRDPALDEGLRRGAATYLAEEGELPEAVQLPSDSERIAALMPRKLEVDDPAQLSPDEREALAMRLAVAWPEPDEHQVLAAVGVRVELLTLLGHEELVASGRDVALDAVVRMWNGTYGGRDSAGFSQTQSAAETAGDSWLQYSHMGDVGATQAAIELMGVYGVPPEINLAGVRRWLLGSIRHERLMVMFGLPDERPLARLAIVQLDALAGGPPSFMARVLAYRVVLAAFLLACLCVAATLRAQPRGVRA
ncbi:MAG: hypothetical protein GY711_22525 [bacterium]|nr:hypothetical protein [bacterium]